MYRAEIEQAIASIRFLRSTRVDHGAPTVTLDDTTVTRTMDRDNGSGIETHSYTITIYGRAIIVSDHDGYTITLRDGRKIHAHDDYDVRAIMSVLAEPHRAEVTPRVRSVVSLRSAILDAVLNKVL